MTLSTATKETKKIFNKGRSEARKIFKLPEKCDHCSSPAEHRHHKDANPCNNSPENIEFLCVNCHIAAHALATHTIVPFNLFKTKNGPHSLVVTARKEAKLTQREVAIAMEVTPPYLWDLERGNRSWTDDLISRWEKATGLKFPTTQLKCHENT